MVVSFLDYSYDVRRRHGPEKSGSDQSVWGINPKVGTRPRLKRDWGKSGRDDLRVVRIKTVHTKVDPHGIAYCSNLSAVCAL